MIEGREQAFKDYQVQGMDCANCARSIEEGVGRLKGVQECRVEFTAGRLQVRGSASPRAVLKRVRDLGFKAAQASTGPAGAPAPNLDETGNFFQFLLQRKESRWAALGALLIMPGLIWTEVLGHESLLVDVLSVLAMASAGWPVARNAKRSLSINREINMNVLMSMAAVGAVVIGAYTEAGMVMVLFAIGESLEGYTAGRARRSIRRLMQVVPEKARRMRPNGRTMLAGVEDIQVGERILIKPGERIPMDGKVAEGFSSVNQAPITGESRFVDKQPGEPVYAGTINGQGTLEVLVSRRASESTLSRMIRLVEEAKCRQAPSQRFIDRFARIYTPAVMALAALAAVLPPLLWGLPLWNPEGGGTGWLYRGLALLVVACPCALVISTPVSIISAISQAAHYGILFKGGASLEALSRVQAVAFDKTGTLTEGSPVVVQVRSERCRDGDVGDCEDCDDLVALVSAVERRSEHPLARALVSESIARGVEAKYPDAANVTAMQGQGVSGQVNGRSIQIGSHRLFDSLIPHRKEHCDEAGKAAELGYTPIMVSAEGQYMGFLSLADTVRHTSREALQALRRMGLQALVMLTGDSAGTAQRVAREVGVTDVRAELMPENKVGALEDLKRRHGSVAMVGDGINDTPALSSATVGIALGGSAGGTDQALEASDITLLGGDLRRLPYALRLSRSAMRTIQANVLLSLGLKLAFLVLLVMGLGTMWMAVIADVGTSLLVTLNGMHLLRWPRPEWDMAVDIGSSTQSRQAANCGR